MAKKEKIQIEVEISSDKLHVQHATCPKGHALQDEKVKIHGKAAIKVKIRNGDNEGFIYLDPVYGSHDNIEDEVPLKKDDVVEMFCPECGINLQDQEELCQLCASPMFMIHLPNGGIAEGCLKKGCMFHKMKIVDAEKQIARSFENNTLESYL